MPLLVTPSHEQNAKHIQSNKPKQQKRSNNPLYTVILFIQKKKLILIIFR